MSGSRQRAISSIRTSGILPLAHLLCKRSQILNLSWLNQCVKCRELVCGQEAANTGIIVSALQVVHFQLGIVVISAVTVKIEIGRIRSRTTVVISGDKVTPSIVCIRNQLCTIFIVDSNNIALQILLEPADIILPVEIAVVMILHTNGCSIGIVDIQHKMLAPLLGYDLVAVEDIPVCLTVDHLTGADAFIVVGEEQRVPVSFCLRQPAAIFLGSSGGKSRRCYG